VSLDAQAGLKAELVVAINAAGAGSSGYEGQQGHLPRPPDGARHGPLVMGAGAGAAARQDLAPFRDELAQDANILVVNMLYLVHAELADAASRTPRPARSP